jgi:hypothetical protein
MTRRQHAVLCAVGGVEGNEWVLYLDACVVVEEIQSVTLHPGASYALIGEIEPCAIHHLVRRIRERRM